MERRALRRAADLALLTSLGNAAAGQPGGAPDQDFEYTRSIPAGPVAYDHEPVTAPIPVEAVGLAAPDSIVDDVPQGEYGWVADEGPPAESVEGEPEPVDVYDLVPDQANGLGWDDAREAPAAEVAVTDLLGDYGWYEREELPPAAPAPSRRARPLAEAAFVSPALDFALPDSQRWYRIKPVAAVIVAAVIAAIVCGGWLVFGSPTTTAERSTVQAPTSAPPAPSKAAPTAASAPNPPPAPPPPPPPPPPPSPAPSYTPPQRQYQPRYTEPSPARKPRIDVTRAPMSVAPVPKPVPGSDSNTPGDASREKPRRRGCFGFC